MNVFNLPGCSTSPLANFLKGLGVARLMNQKDANAKFWWAQDSLQLEANIGVDQFKEFVQGAYEPTPIVAPWNGGSGFYSSDNRTAIDKIKASELGRLSNYREVIGSAEMAVSVLSLQAKPDPETKEQLLRFCRNTFPDFGLVWLDAVMVMTNGGPKFPPLLGTGGNDGRLEFTNNFMQRLTEVLGLGTKKQADMSPLWLENSLFGTAVPGFAKSPIGQFNPGNAGGANASTGFDSDSLINPWDFILMMEGALLFAGAAVKRLNSSGGDSLAYPFCVRQSGTGYGTASFSDEAESRAEMWMPIWETPATLREIEQLFSEGRAELNGRPAANGVDFTRAVVSLGVDRGITEFQRYGFLVRNGLAYFATPLDRVRVERNPDADVIAEIDGWLRRFRQKATQDKPSPPSSMARALRRIEDGIIRFCKTGESAHAQRLFIALGEGEKSLATSFKWTQENYLKPLSHLSPRWLQLADDGSVEFRLAASLASMVSCFGREWISIRMHLEPVETSQKSTWWKKTSDRNVVWNDGSLVSVMNRIFQRRLLRENGVDEKGAVHMAKISARLDDVAAFIEGRTNDRRIADLLWALVLVDFSKKIEVDQSNHYRLAKPKNEGDLWLTPPSLFALLRSCFCRTNPKKDEPREEMDEVKLAPVIHRKAAEGRGTEASRIAARRLRASGIRPAISEIEFEDSERVAAAMLFPLSRKSEKKLLKMIRRAMGDKPPATKTKTEEFISAD